MFDTVDLQYRLVPVENAGEPLLSDAAFRERAAGQRLGEFAEVAPLRIDILVEFRDDTMFVEHEACAWRGAPISEWESRAGNPSSTAKVTGITPTPTKHARRIIQ